MLSVSFCDHLNVRFHSQIKVNVFFHTTSFELISDSISCYLLEIKKMEQIFIIYKDMGMGNIPQEIAQS